MNKKILNTVFESIANQNPDAIAVVDSESDISYSDLNSYANIIQNLLLQSNVDDAGIVGIYLPHSIEYIASVLGVMKSGSAFMPINPDFPDSRNIKVIQKTHPSVLITFDKYKDKLHQLFNRENLDIPIIIVPARFESLQEQTPNIPTHTPDIKQKPDDNCYIINTSGTTGDPKTIVGRHKGLSHFIHWEIGEFSIDTECKIAIFAPTTFDVSLRDIFVPLISGGTTIVPPEHIYENVTYLVDWINDNNLTHIHIVPSLFRLILTDLERRESVNSLFPNLKYILLAGEPLYGRDVNRWRGLFNNRIELVNLYGPSESTLAKCCNRLNEDSYPNDKIIPVGKPISNTAILILKDNELCPIGEIGELYIKSPFITKGYYNDPELTSQLFIQNPLNLKASDIIYKTGDLGRYLADRSIELLGRLDRQVKVNGNRIELGDIESSVLSHPNVHQCYASVVTNKSNNFIACYFTGNVNISSDDMIKYLASLLPDYMIPSFYIYLDQFPLTINGKIDKRRLPEPDEILYANISYEPPADEYEEKLADIWSQILGIKKVGVDNPFFELGGTSLSAMKLVSEIYQVFSVNLTLKDVFQSPTIRQSAEVIKSKLETEKISKILPLPQQEYYDISPAQRRVWFLHQLQGGDVVNNIPALFKGYGETDIDVLEKALNHVIQRHEALRTSFVVKGSVPVQVISDNGIEIERLRLSSSQDKDTFLKDIFRTEINTPFKLDTAPLMRCKVVKLADKEHAFLMVIHHIIGDGLSLDIIAQEMFTAYSALMEGQEPNLPELSFHYKDFSHWQNEYLQSAEGNRHRQYWHDTFKQKVEPVEFPTDYPRSAMQTFSGKTVTNEIPDHCSKGLSDLAIKKGVSLFTLLTALVKTTIYRYTGQNDITLGTAIAGRNHPDLVNQVGLFVNLVPLRDDVQGDESFKSFLSKVEKTIENSHEHQSYPYDQLVGELNLERTMSRSPLFDINITLQEDYHSFNLPSGFQIEPIEMDWEMSRYDMMFRFRQLSDEMKLDIIYNSSLFTNDTIELLHNHLMELSQSVIELPGKPIDLLNMLPLHEKELLDGFARIDDGTSEIELLVLEKIDKFTELNPDHLALSDGEAEISYGQLSKLTNGVANNLLEKQLPTETIVAMILDRTVDAIVTLIGIMKSGNVYLPIDPKFPSERIETILNQSGCKHIVTDDQYYELVREIIVPILESGNENEKSVYLISDLIHESDKRPDVVVKPESLAYLLFTSGSTGVPKGAMVEHQSLSNSIAGMVQRYGVTPQDKTLQFASLTFDASIGDIYTALTSGASLFVLPRQEMDNPVLFVEFLNNHQISFAVLPPILLRSLNQQPLPFMRALVTAGESPYNEDIEFYSKTMQYINAYGPTECSICISTHNVNDSDLNRARIPIGKPIPNMSVGVLDKNQKTVPIGVPGELYASGVSVSRGYINESELTSKYFVTIPEMSDKRAYRTGDLVRWLPDGQLEYMGRIDKQVKIRGYRIEIEEVEQALLQHPEIGDAAVIETRSEGAHKQLAAFLTRSKKVRSIQPSTDYFTPDELRRYLKKKLPEYMIPQYFMELESIPLTASGKIDRRKLDELFVTQPHQHKQADRLPNEIEAQLIKVWEAVLGRTGIGINDDFFSMGGDSIKAIQIIARLYQNNIQLSVADIFKQSTIKECAKVVKFIDKYKVQRTVTGSVPLTAIQEWFFETYGDMPHHFHQSLTLFSESRIDMNALNTALNMLISQHDMLRTVIRKEGEQIKQEILPIDAVKLDPVFKDLRGFNDLSELEKEIEGVHSSINIEHNPLINVGVFRIQGGSILHIVIHHLAVDGISWRVIMEDFTRSYLSLKLGSEDYLPVKTASFKEWSENIHTHSKSNKILNELPFWKSQASQSRIGLNYDYPNSKDGKYTLKEMEKLSYSLNSELTSRLLDMWRHKNIKTDVYLLTLFARNFLKQQNSDRISILMEGHGREELFPDIDTSRTVGWFTSIYPLVLSFNPDSELDHCLNMVRSSLSQIPSNGIGYGILRYITSQSFKEAQSLNFNPKIRFNYLGHFNTDIEIEEFQFIDSYGDKNQGEKLPAEVDIAFEAMIANGELNFNLLFNNHLFSDMSMLEFYSGILTDIYDDLQGSTEAASEIDSDDDIDEMLEDFDLMDD
ncbi:MAG: amino acid adenylation domain-containing protein [Candidatus Hatepunaea meridiana]|nr:amino acid adenylation domain-containing protein [Candidatus Hatepunaea meridiana]